MQVAVTISSSNNSGKKLARDFDPTLKTNIDFCDKRYRLE